jgi:hypothetical protein
MLFLHRFDFNRDAHDFLRQVHGLRVHKVADAIANRAFYVATLGPRRDFDRQLHVA